MCGEMILQREHARLLMRMLEDREKGQVRTAFEETEEGLLLELEMADLVTEMREVKHPFRQGAQPLRGIEF